MGRPGTRFDISVAENGLGFVIVMLRDTALVSVVVSIVLAAFLSRFSATKPSSAAVALAASFFAAWASQSWTTLTPTRYLHWFPYVTVALAVVAIVMSVDETKRWPWVLATLCCIMAAWLLVPSFRSLQPRRLYAIGISIFTLVLAFGYEELARRISPRLLTTCLMTTGVVAATVLAQSFGLKFAQITGMLTAGLAGGLVVTFIARDLKPIGLSLIFSVVITHLMFVGWANSSSKVTAFCFALPPLAPLALWVTGAKPPVPRQRFVAGLTVVALLLLLALVPAILAHPPWEGELE